MESDKQPVGVTESDKQKNLFMGGARINDIKETEERIHLNNLSLMQARRNRLSNSQMIALEKIFETVFIPTTEEKILIANTINMPIKSIHIWFQNRRSRERKVGTTNRVNQPDSFVRATCIRKTLQTFLERAASKDLEYSPRRMVENINHTMNEISAYSPFKEQKRPIMFPRYVEERYDSWPYPRSAPRPIPLSSAPYHVIPQQKMSHQQVFVPNYTTAKSQGFHQESKFDQIFARTPKPAPANYYINYISGRVDPFIKGKSL